MRQTSMSNAKTVSVAADSDPRASSSSALAIEVIDRAVIEQQMRGRNELDACIDFLEATLVRANSGGGASSSPEFLCGAAPSIADLVIATSLVVWDALPVRERPFLDESHHRPRLHRWLGWWAARPEWRAAHAEHDAFSAKRRAELE
jgi:glutathione S-transferase